MPSVANDRLAVGLGLGAALLWSTAATAFKLTLARLDLFQVLFWSVLIACVCLAVIVGATGRWERLRQQTGADWLRPALLGLLNPLAYYLILFEAYSRLPAQVALALNYSWPIALMLLSVPLLRHRIRPVDGLAALVCYGGVIVVSLPGGAGADLPVDGTGILLALGSTLVWAGYWLARTGERGDPVIGLLQSVLVALPCTAVACVVASEPAWPGPAALAGVAWIGLFEMGITFLVWLQALRHASSAARVALLIYVSPFLSLVFVHFVVGEAIRVATLVGLALIIGALLLQQLAPRPDAARPV